MLGDQHRFDAPDQRLQSAEMSAVEFLGAAQGQRNPVKAHRIVAPQFEEPVECRCLGQIILGMHFEKAERRPDCRDLCYVRRAQTDTDAGHDCGPGSASVNSS